MISMMTSVAEPEVAVFLDSNVVLYSMGTEQAKKERALELIALRPVISTQVINECSHVLRRKAGWSPAQVAAELTILVGKLSLVEVGMGDIRNAWRISERYGYSHFDSLIIATGLSAGCDTL